MLGDEKYPANYVRSHRFGLPPLGNPELKTLLHQGQAVDKYGNYNNILASILLKEAYEVEYDLYNHNDPELQHPLQGHLMTEKKMLHKHGPVKKLMRRYHDYSIQKYFGISLLEFLKLPYDRYLDLLDIAFELIQDEVNQVNRIEAEQNKLMNTGMADEQNQINGWG